MKKISLIVITVCMMISCNQTKTEHQNPFLKPFETPYGVPPFDQIEVVDYVPAFKAGIKEQDDEIQAIVNNPEAPTFENTIVELDKSGETLSRVSSVFFALSGANTNNEIDSIAKLVQPMLSEHNDNINLNEKLFKKIESIKNNDYENRNTEQKRLIDNYYKGFIRSGIALNDAQKDRLRAINKELSALSLKFGENVLKETSSYELVIDNEEDLVGLPESLKKAAAETAKTKGQDGKWVFTLNATSWEPFVQYAKNRDLRKQIFTAMNHRANNNNEFDNKAIVGQIVELRLERANMLGYNTFADYALEERMAKNPENVNKLLDNLWAYAIPKAKEESAELLKMANAEGDNISQIEPWDWWYYAEKVRQQKYNMDEEAMKPYFKEENVRNGVFAVANKLYGVNFNPIDVPVYQEDVKAFEVTDADSTVVGIIYFDSYARPGAKRPGAWMGSFRKQSKKDGDRVIPIIYNVGNYNPPSDGKPALLSIDQVNTMFHEFGHGLHGLLSNTNYLSQSGTAVARDFVELPSQLMEHWAFEPEVMKMYAKHYETGEVIPDELIEKINATSTFNQGFRTTELVAAAMLDMAYYTLPNSPEFNKVKEGTNTFDVEKFEKETLEKKGLIGEIIPRYRSTYFQHIFSGGYSAGYYSYLWSEVLDADAYSAFEENGIFDPKTAKAFRDNVLSKGDTEDPMTLYKQFRGAEPDEIHMLKNRGLVK